MVELTIPMSCELRQLRNTASNLDTSLCNNTLWGYEKRAVQIHLGVWRKWRRSSRRASLRQ